MVIAWTQFLVCAAAIALAGYRLARYGDIIAEKTRVTATWIGIIMIATVTSLPELVTGISSVTVADVPDIAVGDVMGSCVFNLALVAMIDFVDRETPIYMRASHGHILSASFSVVLIGVAVSSLLTRDVQPSIAHVGISSLAIVALYLVAMRSIFVQERRMSVEVASDVRYDDVSLREAILGYTVSGSIVIVAGTLMPFTAKELARVMDWGQSFVGTLLVAAATSLPEVAATLGALRIGALDLAIGNLLGSNLFNILVLAIDDLAYLKGPLLGAVSDSHAVSGVSAIVMTGMALIGIHYRPRTRLFRIVGWVSLALVLVFVLNSLVTFLSGH